MHLELTVGVEVQHHINNYCKFNPKMRIMEVKGGGMPTDEQFANLNIIMTGNMMNIPSNPLVPASATGGSTTKGCIVLTAPDTAISFGGLPPFSAGTPAPASDGVCGIGNEAYGCVRTD